MEMTLQDRSNYLKGLLILIGKDKKISESEREKLIEISDLLGFDRKFCSEAIDEILNNEYIIEEPPLFSNIEIAKAFIKDGIILAFSDKELHLYELNWLNSIIKKNRIEPGWGLNEFDRLKKHLSEKANVKPPYEISILLKKGEVI